MEISIGNDFSNAPAGRNRADGPFSGEAFREDVLLPNLERYSTVRVLLDGPEGYGSSFLEEAFGGLLRNHNFSLSELRNRVELISDDRALISEVWSYIEDSSEAKRNATSF